MRLPRRPSDLFDCTPLKAVLTAKTCVQRQRACEGQRTRDTWRGQAPTFPACADCPFGRTVRRSVGSVDSPAAFGQEERRRHLAARRRAQIAGLLEPVPDLDEPPEEPEELDREREEGLPW